MRLEVVLPLQLQHLFPKYKNNSTIVSFVGGPQQLARGYPENTCKGSNKGVAFGNSS